MTPGNRAAAVVAGINIIVFATIATLAHREKLHKKRHNQIENVTDRSSSHDSLSLNKEAEEEVREISERKPSVAGSLAGVKAEEIVTTVGH